MSQQGYMAYLPTVEFGPGMTSATEIRAAWPQLNEKRKTALVMSLYPRTQTNPNWLLLWSNCWIQPLVQKSLKTKAGLPHTKQTDSQPELASLAECMPLIKPDTINPPWKIMWKNVGRKK
jgi:hypothetical protein